MLNKRLISFATAIVMTAAVTAVPAVGEVFLGGAELTASAADVLKSGDYTYSVLDDGTICLTGYNGAASKTDVTIPSTLEGKRVTAIGVNCFRNKSGIQHITIPNTIVDIDGGAFYGCSSIETLVIPDSVKAVGESAFAGCSLITEVTLSKNLKKIEAHTFQNCECIKKISIPNGVLRIDDYAFSGCRTLSSVEFPNTLSIIGKGAFLLCTNLKSVSIPETVTAIYSYAIGFTYDYYNESIKDYHYEGLKIYCVPGSAGESYAKRCNFEYENISEAPGISTHTHSYTSKVTKAATCTAEGTRTYTCTDCGDSYTETIAKTAHSYKTTVVAPTTAAQGYTLHTCTVCGDSYKDNYTEKLTAETISILQCKASLSSKNVTYSGKTKIPALTLTYNGTKLVRGTDYTLAVKDAVNVGKAALLITGTGKFTGRALMYYYIVPVKPTISSVKSSTAKKLTVKWKKNSTATGYQIQVSMKKNFSSKKSYSVSKNSTVKGTISKLTSGKTYYVRMRCYKTIDGAKRYSAYSAVKSVKVK